MKRTNKIGLIGLVGGLLGAWGGADNTSKSWRRICIPLIITACAYYELQNLWVVTIMSLAGGLSLGYGIPSSDGDKGSSIGRIWYKIFKGNHLLADIGCRAHIAFIKSVALLSIPIIKGNYILYGIISLGTIINDVLWGGIIHPKGMFTLFGKKLLWEEFLIYFVNTVLALILIYF
jgi:hypothetical protein